MKQLRKKFGIRRFVVKSLGNGNLSVEVVYRKGFYVHPDDRGNPDARNFPGVLGRMYIAKQVQKFLNKRSETK